MCANYENCGAIVEAEDTGRPVRGNTTLHFSGECPGCGATVQWHQTVIGLIAEEPLMGVSRICSLECKHHNSNAVGQREGKRVDRGLIARASTPCLALPIGISDASRVAQSPETGVVAPGKE
jgi:hypothetical protein